MAQVPMKMKNNKTISHILFWARTQLHMTGIPSPDLDAEVLLSWIIKKDRAYLLAHPEQVLSQLHAQSYRVCIKTRMRRIPVAYIMGEKDFFGIPLVVSRATLIPRPETEILVESVIEYSKGCLTKPRILDIGTGSGAIALALSRSLPNTGLIGATDISPAALTIARKNARRLGVKERIQFFNTDSIPKGVWDIVVSNPPYISRVDYKKALCSCPELHAEPKTALIGGQKGFEIIENIIACVAQKQPQAALFLEIGSGQARSIARITRNLLPRHTCSFIKDLSRRTRIATILPL